MRHAIPSVLIHAVMARVAAIALASGTVFGLPGCSLWLRPAIWATPTPSGASEFKSMPEISLDDDLQPNQCRVYLVRPGWFYDTSFMVCKVTSRTTEVTCEPDTRNVDSAGIGKGIITEKTVEEWPCASGQHQTTTTTTATELTFPTLNAQGMAGPIFGILGAGLAATAAFAATR